MIGSQHTKHDHYFVINRLSDPQPLHIYLPLVSECSVASPLLETKVSDTGLTHCTFTSLWSVNVPWPRHCLRLKSQTLVSPTAHFTILRIVQRTCDFFFSFFNCLCNWRSSNCCFFKSKLDRINCSFSS
jgi:hypothetical protein